MKEYNKEFLLSLTVNTVGGVVLAAIFLAVLAGGRLLYLSVYGIG